MVLTRAIEYVAQQSSGLSSDIVGTFLQYGVVGVFLLLFVLRKIRTDGEVKDKDAQIDKLQNSLEEYTKHYQTEVLPALIGATAAIATATKVSGDMLVYLNRHSD